MYSRFKKNAGYEDPCFFFQFRPVAQTMLKVIPALFPTSSLTCGKDYGAHGCVCMCLAVCVTTLRNFEMIFAKMHQTVSSIEVTTHRKPTI